jgi:hypothetical protein
MDICFDKPFTKEVPNWLRRNTTSRHMPFETLHDIIVLVVKKLLSPGVLPVCILDFFMYITFQN